MVESKSFVVNKLDFVAEAICFSSANCMSNPERLDKNAESKRFVWPHIDYLMKSAGGVPLYNHPEVDSVPIHGFEGR